MEKSILKKYIKEHLKKTLKGVKENKQMLNESGFCNPPMMSGGVGNNCGINGDCSGVLVNADFGNSQFCLCQVSGGGVIGGGSDAGCPQGDYTGGTGGGIGGNDYSNYLTSDDGSGVGSSGGTGIKKFPVDRPYMDRGKSRSMEPTEYTLSRGGMREASKMMFTEEDLIGPKPKWAQDWLDGFDEFCNCPPPYAPCQCNGAVIPPEVPVSIWKTLQPIATPDVIKRLFLTDYSGNMEPTREDEYDMDIIKIMAENMLEDKESLVNEGFICPCGGTTGGGTPGDGSGLGGLTYCNNDTGGCAECCGGDNQTPTSADDERIATPLTNTPKRDKMRRYNGR